MKNIPWLIILVLIGIILLERSCSDCDCPEIEIVTDTVIEPGDTVITEVEVPVPEPVYVELPPDTFLIIQEVDTALILADYFKKRFYQDTLKDDTSAFVRHDFTIFRNRITGSRLHFQNRRPKTVIKQTISPSDSRRTKFYMGLAIGRNPEQFGGGLSLALNTKRDHLYAFSYDAINKDVYFSVYWKVSF